MHKKLLFVFILFFSVLVHAEDDEMTLVFQSGYGGFTVALPLYGTVTAVVNWGDGTQEIANSAGNMAHSYSSAGQYTVTIKGTVTHFGSSLVGVGLLELVEVKSWGKLGITDLSYAFFQTQSLESLPGTLPDGVTNLSHMFHGNYYFNFDISNWDVSNVTDMSYMFAYDEDFNVDIGGWDVGNVVDMSYMFEDAETFNQDLNNWDVSKVTSMDYMFYMASSFNGNISSWDVSDVASMKYMFALADDFNNDISGWDVSSVADMSGMFYQTNSFRDVNIGNWDVSSTTNMSGMFCSSNFNSDIGSWDVSNVTDMSYLFYLTSSFDQDLASWDVSKVTNMSHMFDGPDKFDCDLSSWDVSNVTDMSYMFNEAESFNGDLSGWDVGNVTNMERMFLGAKAFNNDISGWDVSNVTDMNRMFFNAELFNSDISAWDVGNVTNMMAMFAYAVDFDQDLGKWNVSNTENMNGMFYDVALSVGNYSNTLEGWAEQNLQNDLVFDGGISQYNAAGEAARKKLISDYGWTITDNGKALDLSSLSAGLSGSVVEFNWVTLDVADGYEFMIQRKSQVSGQNASGWTIIDTVYGGSSYNYSFEDNSLPAADTVSYRLKQIDSKDSVKFSETVSVDISSLGLVAVEIENELPTEFALTQNYPNPFNPTTKIEYSLSSSADVSLKVYDMLGREVMTLVNKTQQQGTYSVEFNASNLASGVYIYRLVAGDYVSVKKMMLLK